MLILVNGFVYSWNLSYIWCLLPPILQFCDIYHYYSQW